VVTWICRRGVAAILSGRRQRRTTRTSARPWCTGIGQLTAIDSAAPPVGPRAPRRY